MDGIVYIWKNKVTDQLYIGSHHTDNIDDNYIGSGIYFKRAYQKNPNNFEQLAIQKSNNCRKLERVMLKMLNVRDKDRYYNLKNSALGAGSGIDHHYYGKKRSDSVKERISNTLKKLHKENPDRMRGENHPFYGCEPWNKGKKCPEISERHRQWHKDNPDMFRGSNSPVAKKVEHIESGRVFDTLTEASDEYDMTVGNVSNHCRGLFKKKKFRYVSDD